MKVTQEEIERLQVIINEKLAIFHPKLRPEVKALDLLSYPDQNWWHIPRDINQAWFFKNQAYIKAQGCKAVKSDKQPMDITRAIFFYNLDLSHTIGTLKQSNWEILVLQLYLRKHHTSTTQEQAVRKIFMGLYVDAWLERMRMPTDFVARERYIEFWKTSPYDVTATFAKLEKHRKVAQLQTERILGTINPPAAYVEVSLSIKNVLLERNRRIDNSKARSLSNSLDNLGLEEKFDRTDLDFAGPEQNASLRAILESEGQDCTFADIPTPVCPRNMVETPMLIEEVEFLALFNDMGHADGELLAQFNAISIKSGRGLDDDDDGEDI